MGWFDLHLAQRLRAEWNQLRHHPERLVFDVMLLLGVLYIAALLTSTNSRWH